MDLTESSDDLEGVVNKYFAPFRLVGVMPCGSDANMSASVIATKGMLGSMIVACGAYVSGDGGILQGFSSSSYKL